MKFNHLFVGVLLLFAAVCGHAQDREAKIEAILNELTVEEKVSLCSGGFSHFKGVPRLEIPNVGWCDGPRGPNGRAGATAFPAGILFGATWNPEIVERAGVVMGEELRAMQRRILLGPACNILRDPLCGRFFEYYTEDPCLNSALTVAQVKGIQSPVSYTQLRDNETMHDL
ncbi:MAG: hypothetical protein K2I59_00440, partial [Alistipes sp.]|nr:hypothetical protein [Alistipes sp.]